MPTEVKGIQDETFLPTLPGEFITWNWNSVPRTDQDTQTHTRNNQLNNQPNNNNKTERGRKKRKGKA